MASTIKFLIVLLLLGGCLYFFKEPLSQLWANRGNGAARETGGAKASGEIKDLPFRIVKKEPMKDGSYNLVVELSYRNRTAGVDIMIEPDLVPGQKKKKGSNGLVYFRSLGSKSDWFVEMLSDMYGVEMPSHKMATQVKFDMKIIEGVFDEIEQTPVKIRVTYPMLGADTFAVFNIMIDLTENHILLAEKDMSYRKPILLALTGN